MTDWAISTTGEARHAAADYEAEANRVGYSRTSVEQTTIRSLIPVVAAAVRHARLTPLLATVAASGHLDEDGSGAITVTITLAQP